MRYHNYIRRQIQRDRGLAEEMNYRGQLQRLVTKGVWRPEGQELERAASILEQAGFSSKPITEEELEWMIGKLGR